MNKKLLSCILALALIGTFAFSACAVCARSFALDAILPMDDDIFTSSVYEQDDPEPWQEDEPIILYGYDEEAEDVLSPDEDTPAEKPSMVKSVLICIVIGVVIALLVVLAVKSGYKPVHRRRDAAEYLVDGSLRITAANETFLRTERTERTIENKNTSGSN
jgi:hypothetical protein